MLTKTKLVERGSSHEAPRTVLLIVHAQIFSFVEGWNELQDDGGTFPFQDHAFNFDYLLHLSGINYLIHPDDVHQVIHFVQQGSHDVAEFNIRFINRTGEIKSLVGLARLVSKA